MINDQFDLDINSKENNGRKKFNEKLLSKQTKWIIKFDCDAEDEVSVGNWFISGKFMNSSLSKILQWRQVEILYLGTGRPRDTVSDFHMCDYKFSKCGRVGKILAHVHILETLLAVLCRPTFVTQV